MDTETEQWIHRVMISKLWSEDEKKMMIETLFQVSKINGEEYTKLLGEVK